MKSIRIIIVLFGIGYLVYIAMICAAGAYYSAGLAATQGGAAPALFVRASSLNPLQSEYYFRKSRALQKIGQSAATRQEQLVSLRHAIGREPTNPAYHMFYGLALLKAYPSSVKQDEAYRHVRLAAELKPFSKPYREAEKKLRAP